MGAVAGEAREGFLERRCARFGLEGLRRVKGDEGAFFQNGDAVRQEFDFRERVRGKKKGCALTREDFGFQKAAEVGGSEGIEAARGFIEEKHFGLVEKRADQAQALDGARGQGTHLTAESATQFEAFGQSGDARLQERIGEVVQAPEKMQIFTAGETRVEAQVGTGMVAQMAAERRGLAGGIEPGDNSGAARREEESGEYAQQRRFAGAVGAQQSDRFAWLNVQGNSTERRRTRSGKRLQKGAPATVGRREGFFQRIDGDCGIGHSRVYSVSLGRKQ